MWQPVSEHELHLYVDGRLDRGRRATVEAYLDANPDEGERIVAYGRQNALLRALGDAIAAELPAAGERRLRLTVARLFARRKRRRGAAVASLLLAAVASGAGVELWRARPDTLPASAAFQPPDLSRQGFDLVSAPSTASGTALQFLYRDKDGRHVTLVLTSAQPAVTARP